MQLEHLISLTLARVLGRSGKAIAHHCCDCCIGILSEYMLPILAGVQPVPHQGFCERHPPGKSPFVLALNVTSPATLAD